MGTEFDQFAKIFSVIFNGSMVGLSIDALEKNKGILAKMSTVDLARLAFESMGSVTFNGKTIAQRILVNGVLTYTSELERSELERVVLGRTWGV